MRVSKSLLGAAVAAFVPLSAASAQLGFSAVGPVDPANGFPTSYTDTSGVVMAPCLTDPLLCGLDVPVLISNPAAAFPLNYGGSFPEEFFYNLCSARIPLGVGRVANLVVALEGAFLNGPVVAGDQMVFGRVRVRVNSGLVAGSTYTCTTPVGVYSAVADARGRLTFTDDVGLVPGLFSGPGSAMTSHVGPFLRWDSDLPVVDVAGNQYVGIPDVDHTITGSPTGTNFFRIDGPSIGGPGVNRVETNLFSVMGLLGEVTPPPPPVPVANFTAAPLSGTAPLNVAFTDSSTGTITSWLWNFGDGATSTLQNPLHSYAVGTFSVSLTVTGPGGTNTLSRPDLVLVTQAPPPPVGLTLANPVPGLANVANTLVLTGCQPNSVVGLFTGQVLGAGIVRNSRCPLGIPVGLASPLRSLGTVRANAQGVAVFTTTPPRTSSGRLFHFQAVEPSTCSSSNIVSDTL